MYIDNLRGNQKPNHKPNQKEKQISAFFRESEEPEEIVIEEKSLEIYSSQDADSYGSILHWIAPEFENLKKDRRWYKTVTILLLAIIAYAVYTNSPIMAITFILIGVVGYIYVEKEPRVLDFYITYDGIIAGKEIYEFDNMESFWIFYDPPFTKIISLKMRGSLMRFVHIPVHDQDPIEIRTELMRFIPEAKHEPGLVDTLERMLHI